MTGMDRPRQPALAMRLVLEVTRSADGRFEGSIHTDTTDPAKPFSGILELLKVLEECLSPQTLDISSTSTT